MLPEKARKNITQDICSSCGKNPKSTFLRDVSMDRVPQTYGKSNSFNNKEKAAALLRDVGLQLSEPVAYAENLSERIIAEYGEDVNTLEEITENEEKRSSISGENSRTANLGYLETAKSMRSDGLPA